MCDHRNGGKILKNTLSVSYIIKRYIKMRGYTIQQVANKLKINYKTLDGILNRDSVDAILLFRIANLLDIDLCWMSQLFETTRPISFLEQYQMTRMNEEMRELEKKTVLSYLDKYITDNSLSISDIKKELMKVFSQLFYLLDVLLPDSYIIRIAVEREKEKYYCMPITEQHAVKSSIFRGRPATMHFYEGHEMLKQIIIERKELLNK